MQIGLIGLGTMGGRMLVRLREHGHDVTAFDLDDLALDRAREAGAVVARSARDLVSALPPERVVWLMLPAGKATRMVIRELAGLLSSGDLLVDGGNSDFRDAPGHAELLAESGIGFADVGVSGGQWGWRTGYGLTVGGPAEHFQRLEPVLAALAAPDAVAHVGGIGAGHLAKAVHNGVQYGVMQAYAEGYALLAAHDEVDALAAVNVWQNGCSIRSFLLEQMVGALRANPDLEGVASQVQDSGMGRWTAEEAIKMAVPTPVLSMALQARFVSRDDRIASKLLNISRAQVGGQKS